MSKTEDQQEADKRRDELARRVLKMKPKPRKPKDNPKPEGQKGKP